LPELPEVETVRRGLEQKLNNFIIKKVEVCRDSTVAFPIYKEEFMSGDFETLEINQPKIKYLKPEENTGWLDKLIKNIEDMKNKLSRDT